ncbi:hypothetical protein [Porphyromonas endodontalis]|uniref:hypothetical protein n=1 Tax=Porphyromonas endodontalis TaxID=28124 RepID=UPI003C7E7C1D
MTTSEEAILAGYHPQSSLRKGGVGIPLSRYKSTKVIVTLGASLGEISERREGAVDTPKGGKEAIFSLLVHSNGGIFPFGYKKTPRDFP